MNKNVSVLVFALGALMSATGFGCGDDDDDERTGTLQQRWTIAGVSNPEACNLANAEQMRLVIIDSAGFTDATQFAPCRDLRLSLQLVPDRYTGTATFLGDDGLPVSRVLALAPFNIVEGQTTDVTVDFTVGDILAR